MDLEPLMAKEEICPTDRLSNLPEEILMVHIFSLFKFRQVCLTSCVSRKFRRLLYTNPDFDIDLDESGYSSSEVFQAICDTMERYRENQVPIKTFKLNVQFDEYFARYYGQIIISWIETAVKNHVDLLDVFIYPNNPPPFDDEKELELPADIVLSSKSLKVLKLSNLEIVSKSSDYEYINLGLLETLRLVSVECKDEKLVSYILNSCQVKYLELHHCFISEINMSQPNIRKVAIWQEGIRSPDVLGTIDVKSRSIEDFFYERGWGDRPDFPVSIKYPEQLVSLRKLSIFSAAITDEMVKNIVPRLPLLEDLELSKCYRLKTTKISSSSLKKLKLRRCKKLVDVEINAVSMEMFGFRGLLYDANFPQLLFLTERPASCKASIWQDADLDYGPINTKDFTRIREILVKSDVFNVLSLQLSLMTNEVEFNLEDVTEIFRGPAYKIDELKLWTRCYNLQETNNLPVLMEGVLWTCNPRVLSLTIRQTKPSHVSSGPNEYKIIVDQIGKLAISGYRALKSIEVGKVDCSKLNKKFGFEGGRDTQLNLMW